MPAAFKMFCPPSLVDIVDAVWDLDIPDGDAAKALTIKYPPGTSILLIAQYRAPFRTAWQSGPSGHAPSKYATQVQTGVVSLHPTGPLGVIIVCLKPEAAACILGAPIRSFAEAKIDLRNLFNVGDVFLCDEMLAEARNSRERIATVEGFLSQHARRPQPDSVACRAASVLRRNPALPVHRLASQLDVSKRQLSRGFKATFGTTPKQFARLARVEKALAAWHDGGAWPDIAYAYGFADQAHMIKEFNRIIGQAPADFVRSLDGVRLLQFYRPVTLT